MIILIMNCVFHGTMQGQSLFAELKHNHQIWLDAAPTYDISDRITYIGDLGIRILVTDLQWTRIYHRPSIKYLLNDTWALRGGLGWIYEDAKDADRRFELRPWQGIQATWPRFEGLKFIHLLRSEQRINHLFEEDLTEFEFRMRMRVGFRWRSMQFQNGYSLIIPASVEWFVPVTEAVKELFSNRTRVEAGFAIQDDQFLEIRFTVNWQNSKVGFEDDLLVNDWLYRLIAIFSLGRSDIDNAH